MNQRAIQRILRRAVFAVACKQVAHSSVVLALARADVVAPITMATAGVTSAGFRAASAQTPRPTRAALPTIAIPVLGPRRQTPTDTAYEGEAGRLPPGGPFFPGTAEEPPACPKLASPAPPQTGTAAGPPAIGPRRRAAPGRRTAIPGGPHRDELAVSPVIGATAVAAAADCSPRGPLRRSSREPP